MQFEAEQRIAAPREAVEAAYVDPAYLVSLGDLPKIGEPQLLDQEQEGARVRQRVRHRFTGDVSGAVRRVVDPARLTWVEERVFDRATHRSDVCIVPDHYGNLLETRMTIFFLADGDTTTVRHITGEVKVHVPIVGGRVERAIISGLKEQAAVEAEALERYAAG